MEETMMRSSSSSTLWRGAQPRGSRVRLRNQEPGRQEKLILRRPGTDRNPSTTTPTLWHHSPAHSFTLYLAIRGQRCPGARRGHLMTPEVWF